MAASYTASSAQLSSVKQVFEAYCQKHRITDPADREMVAAHMMARFGNGAVTAQDLEAGLAPSPAPRAPVRAASDALQTPATASLLPAH